MTNLRGCGGSFLPVLVISNGREKNQENVKNCFFLNTKKGNARKPHSYAKRIYNS